MAKTTRQTAIFGVEDWKQFYQTYREADFQSYDFETLRKSFVDYLRLYYPETFNDYIESSEFIALLDVMAFMGQALAFRTDLNTRENFIDTAERRDSVTRLANLVSYTPKRNIAAQGYLKVFSVQTTENVTDYNGINLSNVTVDWNDPTNPDWQEQFTVIINAALVDSQRVGRPGNSQTILGVKTDEYTVNLIPGYLPVLPFNSTVDNINMAFEAVSATSIDQDYVYEPAPRPNGAFNVLYRNDSLGFASANTGYFFLFKQGSLQSQDFNLAERVSNRSVNINIEGINNDDRWLYQLDDIGTINREWKYVDSVYAAAVEQLEPDQRAIYSVNSRVNDQIALSFGDGVFSEIPVGLFRVYVRASNGLQYIINTQEMQSITLPISYVSRSGRVETVTFTCGLTTPVSNARGRETIAEIKQRAPARYYTQNRMVNGEDYNLFPFTNFSTILKSKALNRSSIGTSRYFDLVDPTGKYSSTNVFADDGAIYRQNVLESFQFTWSTLNEIADAIVNQVEPALQTKQLQHFYFEYFPRPDLSSLGLIWNRSTTATNETTGYFKNSLGVPQAVGPLTSDNRQYVTVSSLVKFVPPSGYCFDINNRLKLGSPTADGDKTVIWASPLSIDGDGTNQGSGNLADGLGPVAINQYVPTGAIANQVIPVFTTDLPSSIDTAMTEQIQLYRNFGLGYDNYNNEWYLITSNNLDQDAAFSLGDAGNNDNTNSDASWLIQFVTDGEIYTVTVRGLSYYFGSVLQNRFFYDGDVTVYDSKTGTVIQDFVKVLRSNSQPDSSTALTQDVVCNIIGQTVESDGFVNDYQVEISYQDSDADGVPDNPDFFDDLVAPTVNPQTKLVFLQQVTDFDNLERYILVAAGVINSSYATLDDLQLVKTEFVNGQVFYTYTDEKFYELVITDSTYNLVESFDYQALVGRNTIYFQYRHNSPLTRVIDPATTNIIDLYVVTLEYYTQYQNYIRDTTGTVSEPERPTIAELSTAYSSLNDYKMISDSVILNSVRFKPLFGSKAATELQATIKVVQVPNSTVSISEIKNQVLANMNNYFTLDKWNFGDTFYFSELAAYLHREIGDIVSSVVLVPKDLTKTFGDLYEINSAPDEIFVNAATINDIEVISSLTNTTLRTGTATDVTGATA